MKKYLLVSLTLLFAAAFLWADEVTNAEQKAAFEGSATLSWGIDLGKGKDGKFSDRAKHGFKNDASWKVTFPLLKEGDKSSKNPAEAPVYAEVELKKISLGFESKNEEGKRGFYPTGKVDGISGKLVFYGAYLLVYDKPGFKTNYAVIVTPPINDDFKDDNKFEPGFEGAGTKLGYKNDDFYGLDVGLKLGSNGNWESKETKQEDQFQRYELITPEKIITKEGVSVPAEEKWVKTSDGTVKLAGTKLSLSDAGEYKVFKLINPSAAVQGKYGMGIDFSMKPLAKMLTFDLQFNTTFGAAKNYEKDGKVIKGYNRETSDHQNDKVALGFGTKITSEPVDGLKFTFGFDGGYGFKANTKTAFGWDMRFDVGYKKWFETGIYVAGPATKYGLKKDEVNNKDITNMAVSLKLATEDDLKGLKAGIHIGMYDLLKKRPKTSKETLDMSMKLWINYKADITDGMWIKPFFNLYGATNCTAVADGSTLKKPYFGIAYDLGVTYSPFEKLELAGKWSHGETDNNKISGGGAIKAPVQYKNHNGRFVLSLKVIY